MNWIRNMRNMVNRQLSRNSIRISEDMMGSTSNISKLHSQGISFTLYNASGGYVVELRGYDVKNDQHNVSLHVIPNKDDLGESLSHIITLEMLRK
jgi:hypothetical protein